MPNMEECQETEVTLYSCFRRQPPPSLCPPPLTTFSPAGTDLVSGAKSPLCWTFHLTLSPACTDLRQFTQTRPYRCKLCAHTCMNTHMCKHVHTYIHCLHVPTHLCLSLCQCSFTFPRALTTIPLLFLLLPIAISLPSYSLRLKLLKILVGHAKNL